ncbi:hypothetical protein H808_YJM1388J00077 [Saccharomyces cerevisiae YJM1388]|uniref:K7_Yjl136w-ap n=1 Tax=Saccharomyces cerevisiae (strain Kyokai no. 7 / NBRC 101557) TaxID=721032 RepID=G2WGN4_YEASK
MTRCINKKMLLEVDALSLIYSPHLYMS